VEGSSSELCSDGAGGGALKSNPGAAGGDSRAGSFPLAEVAGPGEDGREGAGVGELDNTGVAGTRNCGDPGGVSLGGDGDDEGVLGAVSDGPGRGGDGDFG